DDQPLDQALPHRLANQLGNAFLIGAAPAAHIVGTSRRPNRREKPLLFRRRQDVLDQVGVLTLGILAQLLEGEGEHLAISKLTHGPAGYRVVSPASRRRWLCPPR